MYSKFLDEERSYHTAAKDINSLQIIMFTCLRRDMLVAQVDRNERLRQLDAESNR